MKQLRERNKWKNKLEEQYLSNKLTRQFILCANLVLQGRENLSSDTELNFDQFREFAIRFGLLTEKSALEETSESMLLNELWHILSRKQLKLQSIKILNLKTIVTAILGFSIMVVDSKLPYAANNNSRPAKNRARIESESLEFAEADQIRSTELEEDMSMSPSSKFLEK
jgi:hypothetical protein